MTNKETAQKIVDRMLETIAAGGKLPWVKPWSSGSRTVTTIDGYTTVEIPVTHWSRSGKAYQGINPMLLDFFGKSGEMITFNQCKAEGGKIKKGAKGAPIIFWSMIVKDTGEVDEDGNPILKKTPVLKTYTVFSVEDDTEGLEVKHHPDPIIIKLPRYVTTTEEGSAQRNEAAEAIIADYLARAKTLKLHADSYSDRAFYSPALDSVTVPCIQQFSDVAEYYSTTFHELGHSTGHASRLNRFTETGKNAAFGSETYSREELVAEITAATILSTLGLESGNSFRNSAAYVQGWSEHIKNDPMMFVTAATRAEKAIELILGQA